MSASQSKVEIEYPVFFCPKKKGLSIVTGKIKSNELIKNSRIILLLTGFVVQL